MGQNIVVTDGRRPTPGAEEGVSPRSGRGAGVRPAPHALSGRASALLRVVHAHSDLTRAEVTRSLGISTGVASELVARLVAAELLAEVPGARSGARGRPTGVLRAHPAGPLVLAAAISHESWRVEVVELGGGVLAALEGLHDDDRGDGVLTVLAEAVERFQAQFPGRVRGLGVSAPGTVTGGRTLDATILGWRQVDLHAIWPDAGVFVADNDATLAAVAESRRGAGAGATTLLYLHIDAGLGGAVIERGRVVRGADGVAGEFGHMPFGDPRVQCPCGARGCWGTDVDGGALARRLGHQTPRDPVSYARRILDLARQGGAEELRAARRVASDLGRGTAGLVNALNPDVVLLGGLGADLLTTAPEAVRAAYRAGLMDARRRNAPSLRPSDLGAAGSLVGAAELVWMHLLADRASSSGGLVAEGPSAGP